MSDTKNTSNQNPSTDAHAHESEQQAAERRAGVTDKSSHDEKSREKAGSDKGAGGGAKQEQKH